jgi:hypothetical protein
MGTSTWGDHVRLTGTCLLFSYTDRSGHWYWVPSPAVETMLESALHSTGRISGKLLGVGGPAPGLSLGWSGTVHLTNPASKFVLTAGPHGFFAGQVDPGRYRVVGHSPSYNGGLAACNPLHPYVTVRAHQTVRVNVLCQMK